MTLLQLKLTVFCQRLLLGNIRNFCFGDTAWRYDMFSGRYQKLNITPLPLYSQEHEIIEIGSLRASPLVRALSNPP